MACLYADEQFPRAIVEFLCSMDHDILTVQEAGQANKKIPDDQVLAFAVREHRAILTMNRRHFVRLHSLQPDHFGIIVCTGNEDFESLARRINEAILLVDSLKGKLIRVYRIAPPSIS
jgi:predicted nuclease of predicted toxin-antitoxin system